MIHVALPSSFPQQRLPFYLAMEEWVAKSLPAAEYFFTWTSDPTVICGRNQDMDAELNREYCDSHGIQYCRRKSGGGCVYSDRDNIMTSCITPNVNVTSAFARYTGLLARALADLGLDASATGRNDVLIGNRKVAGCAFYHVPGRSIAHGTMLYSTNMEHMLNAITPSRSKLESKQVQSVQSHITTIAEHLPQLTIDDLRRHLIRTVTDSEIMLTPEQIQEIRGLESSYYRPEWLAGRKRAAKGRQAQACRRIEGCGSLRLSLRLDAEGSITDAALDGDFFALADLAGLLNPLLGRKPAQSAEALAGIDADAYISGLATSEFIDMVKSTTNNITSPKS